MPAAAYANRLQYFDPQYVRSRSDKVTRKKATVEVVSARARDLLVFASVLLRDEGHERVTADQIINCLRSIAVDFPNDIRVEEIVSALSPEVGFRLVDRSHYELV
jgi:hypothetical protein